MNEAIVYVLILIIIIQFIILFYILKRRGVSSPARLKKKQPSDDDKISREACEELGGTDRDGRCIVLTIEGNRECIIDIGGIYEENNSHISNSN